MKIAIITKQAEAISGILESYCTKLNIHVFKNYADFLNADVSNWEMLITYSTSDLITKTTIEQLCRRCYNIHASLPSYQAETRITMPPSILKRVMEQSYIYLKKYDR